MPQDANARDVPMDVPMPQWWFAAKIRAIGVAPNLEGSLGLTSHDDYFWTVLLSSQGSSGLGSL